MTETTDKVPGSDKTAEVLKDTNKAIAASLKNAAIDMKSLYAEWLIDPDESVATLNASVAKHSRGKIGIDQPTMDAVIAAFTAMRNANTKAVKVEKPIPDGLSESLAQAWIVNRQVIAQYESAKKALETLWCKPRETAANEYATACKDVESAGFYVDKKTGTVKTTKTGNAGKVSDPNAPKTERMGIAWLLTVDGVNYLKWAEVAKKFTPALVTKTPVNYCGATTIVADLVAAGHKLEVAVKVTDLEKWNATDESGIPTYAAHRKLHESGIVAPVSLLVK
jgi:hypothetical protein